MIVSAAAATTVIFLGLTAAGAVPVPPSASFDRDWQMTAGVTLEDGVLRIEGSREAYRAARLTIPAEALGNRPFFFAVDARLHDVRTGPMPHQAPKLKFYHQGGSPYAADNLPEIELEEWTLLPARHRILPHQETRTITL